MRLLIIIIMLSGGMLRAQEFTTIILVRHAEKDMTASTNDPDLSPAGMQRQADLTHTLMEMDLDAIYSTPYVRTRRTVEGLAFGKNLEILEYDPFDDEELHKILHENQGGTILFSGHSNTVPSMLNMLTQSTRYSALPENAYDDLYIVMLYGTESRVLHLQYGEPDQ
jgi:2,3-bisphosphoglycerate-dependent phosphoglycerate mutase